MTATAATISDESAPATRATSGGMADTAKGWRHGKTRSNAGDVMRGRPPSVHPGERYGRLVVLEEVDPGVPKGNRVFRCECDCGATWEGHGSALKKGHTRSCGCYKSETSAKNAKGMGEERTHGLSRHPDYVAWQSMVRRCTDPRTKDWARYGAKGVKVCDRWRENFANFHADMGSRPERGWHLHRIDNARGYEPDNCEWLSPSDHGRLHAKLRQEVSS